jgi:hypothetical protein
MHASYLKGSNRMKTSLLSVLLLCAALSACGSDNEADALGIGAECVAVDECDEEGGQECLGDFKGGYCGIKDCIADTDCPESSACIAHDDGTNYCFRTCLDKAECNANRSADQESNCSGNVTFVEERDDNLKACVPPSS